jgi:hypothetical protein
MGLGTTCFADLAAIDVTPVDWTGFIGYQANQGWKYVANRDITVTHLGLYDGPNSSGASQGDGFLLEHPIGLWDPDDDSPLLLTSGTIPSGMDTELLDGFRYIDVPDVSLAQGKDYVVGCYADTWTDGMWTWQQWQNSTYFTWSTDPAIQYVSALWGPDTGLALPSTSVVDGSYRFGPNFQFTDTVVPVPGAVLLGIIGLSCAGWRLRRRTP